MSRREFDVEFVHFVDGGVAMAAQTAASSSLLLGFMIFLGAAARGAGCGA